MSIYVFGSNFMTQLGLPEDETLSSDKPLLLRDFDNKKVLKICCGKLHTLVLCENNELYSWGCNDDSALGRDGEEGVPIRINLKVKIVDILAGASYSAVLTDNGQVYTCGTFKSSNGILGHDLENKFQKYFKHQKNLKWIRHLDGGHNHIIAVDKKNCLYSFGANESLQLGRIVRERLPKTSLLPTPISKKTKKENLSFIKATGGSFHSLAINTDNEVYSWGSNFNGQLGNSTFVPSENKTKLELKNIVDISCGINHSLFLNKENQLYGCGDNTHFQLGSCNLQKTSKPILIMNNVNIVRSGCDSTMVLSNDRLFGCGINFAGCLGQDENISEIKQMTEINFDFGKIIDFDCGADFTVAYSEDR